MVLHPALSLDLPLHPNQVLQPTRPPKQEHRHLLRRLPPPKMQP
jgi:hypothetical protein